MIEELRNNGFCKIENVFSDAFIQELKSECLTISDTLSLELREKYRSQGTLVQLLDYPYFSKIIAHDKLFDCFKRLEFRDTVFSSGYLISKPLGAPRFSGIRIGGGGVIRRLTPALLLSFSL